MAEENGSKNMNAVTRSILVLLFTALLVGTSLFFLVKSPRALSARVPFVGCEAEGQAGYIPAPGGESKVFPITERSAERLAYYKAESGRGVLAPRGWYCFLIYGSNGGTLYVAPEEIVSDDLFSATWSGLSGPAIEVVTEFGGTSGRFAVARTIARVFPAHKEFAEGVIKDFLVPAGNFPFDPYPEDTLIYRSNEMVEYQTPANSDGLGTSFGLKKNASPISGVAILVNETIDDKPTDSFDLIQVAIRLPSNLSDLTGVILQQIERNE